MRHTSSSSSFTSFRSTASGCLLLTALRMRGSAARDGTLKHDTSSTRLARTPAATMRPFMFVCSPMAVPNTARATQGGQERDRSERFLTG
eukprot:scaffold118518_cov60-Phaeocystis_antarctica.AAC.2